MMGRFVRFLVATVGSGCLLFLFSGTVVAATYSQVVDNSTPGRFQASSSWGTSSYSQQKYGANYRFATPKAVSDSAGFKVKIPTSGDYRVYARWPASPGYNASAPVGVKTSSGMKWVRVDETQNGGRWVLLGTFRMSAGDGYVILFSRWTSSPGYVVADAVKVVAAGDPSPSGGSVTGQDVLAEAKTWLGVPYVWGGASRQGVDCSGLTMEVYAHFGIYLPHSAAGQYSYGSPVSSPGPGDLVFGDFNGNGTIGHVGIATGDGRMIDAPYPGTVVRYDPIYPQYTVGYRRLVPSGASATQRKSLQPASTSRMPARLPVDEETPAASLAR